MGKGSKPRPVAKPKYDGNWDEINWKSKKKNEEPKETPKPNDKPQ